jgi:hypothetical protein
MQTLLEPRGEKNPRYEILEKNSTTTHYYYYMAEFIQFYVLEFCLFDSKNVTKEVSRV